MGILVLSCGRTGTNMLLEIMRGSSKLTATQVAEHKQLFRSCPKLPDDYLSKCDTCYIDNLLQVKKVLDKNENLKILWTIRDLRDCALSKIYRGQPGNDCHELADDASFKGCLQDIERMKQIYDFIKAMYPERILLVKMEDIISNFEDTMLNVSTFSEVPYEKAMKDFINRYRVTHKAKRYKTLDKNQIALYKRRYKIYNGFYEHYDIDLDLLFEKLEKYLREFKYEI